MRYPVLDIWRVPAGDQSRSFSMLKLSLLAASAVAVVALPTSAEARHRSYYGGYASPYYGSNYYGQGYYGQGYYPQSYGSRYYGNRYNGDRYYGSRHYRRHRCGNGTTGLIVGGAAGALLGREVERSGNRYRYNRGGTTGAIVGGALGALVGREIARDC
jgi:hypothetical protein